MSTGAIDEARLEQFMGRMVGHMTGATACFSIWLGDELGLYGALARKSARSADELAEEASCHRRLVREWLDGQAAAGLVEYDPETDRYSLSAEAALALADDSSPVFVARAMNALGSMFMDVEKLKAAFTGDGALAWGDHHPCLFKGTEWFFRTGYRAHLPGESIPALDGVEDKLSAGARVADVGCGHAPRWSRWPTRTRPRVFGGLTTTRRRSRRRATGPVRLVWRTAPRSRSPARRSIRERTI